VVTTEEERAGMKRMTRHREGGEQVCVQQVTGVGEKTGLQGAESRVCWATESERRLVFGGVTSLGSDRNVAEMGATGWINGRLVVDSNAKASLLRLSEERRDAHAVGCQGHRKTTRRHQCRHK
jgi:hypothetical protein